MSSEQGATLGPERTVFVMRVGADQMPTGPDVSVWALPDGLRQVLAQGWTVTGHSLAFPSLDGAAVLSVYAERPAGYQHPE